MPPTRLNTTLSNNTTDISLDEITAGMNAYRDEQTAEGRFREQEMWIQAWTRMASLDTLQFQRMLDKWGLLFPEQSSQMKLHPSLPTQEEEDDLKPILVTDKETGKKKPLTLKMILEDLEGGG